MAAALFNAPRLCGYELYLYRRLDRADNLAAQNRLRLHGELFGQFQYPCTFPSYNDLSGPVDRWNFGFHNYFVLTPTTLLHAQLVTHDRGGERTKFDWHFSLAQELGRNFLVVIGHDSDHDSDHVSHLRDRPFYTNRNYVGIGLPFVGPARHIEPFLRFFHHTNQRAYLDLSGERLRLEYGLRLGAALNDLASLSLQVIGQSSRVFHGGEMWLADLFVRFRMAEWLEASFGAGVWADRETSRRGNKKTFYKLIWGIAFPFG
ncbi:MAG: hypothetical protein AB1715_10315 [Acidobacteriota bacterium]